MVDLKDETEISDFQILTIDQFPLSKQEELIIKWVQLGNDQKSSDTIDYTKIDIIEDKINNIISVNRIVPRFPFYILSILQTLEEFMPEDLHIKLLGHCYHALIVAQLVKKGIKPDQIDSCFNYLQELAYKIYQTKIESTEFLRAE